MKHHCDWGGCDDTRALGKKYCPRHQREIDARTAIPEADFFAALGSFASKGVAAQQAVNALIADAAEASEVHGEDALEEYARANPPAVDTSPGASKRRGLEAAEFKYGSQRYKVWHELQASGAKLSREEIAGTLNIRLSSVCAIVADLLAHRYLVVDGTTASSAGVQVERVRAATEAERRAETPLPEKPKRAPSYFIVPARLAPTRCSSCGAPVYFITTVNGRPMPIDCAVPNGAAPTLTTDGRGLSHFATCPDASTHRRRKQ